VVREPTSHPATIISLSSLIKAMKASGYKALVVSL
jgi:hypothetical protein